MKVLYVLFLLDTLNLAMYIPIFGAFVTSIGGTPFILGLINSSNALITLLWNPIVGSLSDQIGRKGLLLKCMMASSLGSLILCASSSSLFLVFVARLIGALGSPVAILLRSTVGDIFKTDEGKKIFFNKSAPIISIAFLLGSLSSGFLSEAKNGYLLAFFLMAVTQALASVITRKHLPEDAKPEAKVKNTSSFTEKAIQELKTAVLNIKSISWPRYKQIFYMKGFADLSLAIIFSNVGLLIVQEFQVKGRTVGLIFLMIALCRIASTMLKLKLKNVIAQVPDHKKIFFGGILLFVSYTGMFLSKSVPSFMIFLAVLGLTRPFTDTTFTEIIATKTTDTDRGKVIAAYENLFPFCMFVAPLISGTIAEFYGQRILLGLAAIPISISIWVAHQQRDKTE